MSKSQIVIQQSAYLIAIISLLPSLMRGNKTATNAILLIEIAFVDTLVDQFVLHPSRFVDVGYLPLLKGYLELMAGSFIFSDAVKYYKGKSGFTLYSGQ